MSGDERVVLKVGDTVLVDSSITYYGGLIGIVENIDCDNPHLPVEVNLSIDGGKVAFFAESELTKLSVPVIKTETSYSGVKCKNKIQMLKDGDCVRIKNTNVCGVISGVEVSPITGVTYDVFVESFTNGTTTKTVINGLLSSGLELISAEEEFCENRSEAFQCSSLDNDKLIDKVKTHDTKPKPNTKTKSDGGSSDYYFTKLPKEMIDQIVETGGIEIKDIVSWVFYNDANIKDIVKALKRIKESENGGGKEGTTVEYDLNKINFYVEEFKRYMLIKMKQDGTETTHD